MVSTNPFVGGSVARRYAHARRVFHESVIGVLGERLSRPNRALDVGCGTGASTEPLTRLATSVVGVDASEDMLRAAIRRIGIHYVRGLAEDLPFRAGSFALVSVSSAAHWFHLERFLQQARFVLRSDGFLVVYDDHFTATMDGEPEFTGWMERSFDERFPAPPRVWFSPERVPSNLFGLQWSTTMERQEPMTRPQLMEHLMSFSGVIEAMREGRESDESASTWLSSQLEGLFGESESRELGFRSNIWCLQPVSGVQNRE